MIWKSCLMWCALLAFFHGACDSNDSENKNTNNLNNNNNNTNNINNINNTNNNCNSMNNTNILPHNQNKTESQALAQLFPCMTYEKLSDESGEYYVVYDAGNVAGYGLVQANWGFNGEVRTLSGISVDGQTVGVDTITQRESWWSYIPESFFQQFSGIPFERVTLLPTYDRNCSPRCTVLYESIGVDAVSGATYTSDAIIKNVMDGYLHYDLLRSR